ncbi:TetR/AcrR family transcriptional regulator [Methylomonas paludis]|uniref:TetR/AcrR family transcriptional regulator n=1 Tax=Methylomonas paludis TaxID=1173101 RepID=A0A975MNP4_9GAMM|nr:TetR/AcrR family transcriptional regulator [Methylomonas paludis]QWF71125.1 TetR/AcrR family transcriptional regulator [Methylomonas paludis]
MARNLQAHILHTASGLFYSHGIQATGIDAIVNASGVAKMTLYKYFPSKEALVVAYLRKNAQDLLAQIHSGIQAKRIDQTADKLLLVFDEFTKILASPGFRGCPFINAAAEYADPAHPVSQAVAEFYRTLTEMLTELARQAGINKPQQLAGQLVMLISGAIVTEQIHKQGLAMPIAYATAQQLIKLSQ